MCPCVLVVQSLFIEKRTFHLWNILKKILIHWKYVRKSGKKNFEEMLRDSGKAIMRGKAVCIFLEKKKDDFSLRERRKRRNNT